MYYSYLFHEIHISDYFRGIWDIVNCEMLIVKCEMLIVKCEFLVVIDLPFVVIPKNEGTSDSEAISTKIGHRSRQNSLLKIWNLKIENYHKK